jgi:hypothetical protein
LAHAGVFASEKASPPATSTRAIEVKNRDYYVYAPEPGLFEPFVELGDQAVAGQPCGQVHFVDNPARPAVPCHFRTAGMVVCKRHLGRVERGDCVAHLAADYAGYTQRRSIGGRLDHGPRRFQRIDDAARAAARTCARDPGAVVGRQGRMEQGP